MFLNGFVNAEGCFSIKIQQNVKLKPTWIIRAIFFITLHVKDLVLLESLKINLSVGNISKNGAKTITYSVNSMKEISIIINHFDKYPLITQKLLDYLII
jgi:hypothetical protein